MEADGLCRRGESKRWREAAVCVTTDEGDRRRLGGLGLGQSLEFILTSSLTVRFER